MAKSAKTSKLIVQPETAFSDQPSSTNEKLIPEGAAADAAKLIPAAGLDAAGRSSEPAASLAGPDAPLPGAATGTISTNEPPQSDNQSGAGDTAGSAGSLTLEGLDKRVGDAEAEFRSAESLTLEDLDKRVSAAEAEFRSRCPHLAAAFYAWDAAAGDPVGVRVRSKTEGFRRAGIAHSKTPVDHPLEAFSRREGQRVDRDLLEALFAEPNLIVELI